MNFEALMPQLWQRYPFLSDGSLQVRLGGIKEADVAKWAAEYDGDRSKVYDGLACFLAVGFHERRLPFAFCDAVINDLDGLIKTPTTIVQSCFGRFSRHLTAASITVPMIGRTIQ